ncbi:class I adenylate-forming enzyme family protein [Candidatus Poriferisodalis sp.]|uniref:class I adenylate-forming enzyme family protein n=1 Tax=Candidatus Poriferisodalis sp. TaxID=3101277 RepID=UPI003B02B930
MAAPATYDWLLLGDAVDRASQRWGDRPAVIFGDRRWSYAEFARQVDAVAKGLMALGVQRGDHVAVWMTNLPEWLWLQYGVAKAGGCIVPLNTRYRTDDIAFTVAQSQSRFMISLDRSGPIDYRQMLCEAYPAIAAAGYLELERLVFTGAARNDALSGAMTWDAFLDAGTSVGDRELAERAASLSVDDRMMLAYTSGTTGHPKGVVHTHRPLRNSRERAMLLGHTANDVHMSYLPLFHLFGFGEVSIQAVLTGGCQVLFDTFDPAAVLASVESLGGTVLHGFDSHWGDLLRAHHERPRDMSSLRIGTLAAGMESSTPTACRAQEVFCPTISGWGMSESWAFVSCSHPTDSVEQRTEASGYPMDGIEFQIRDLDTGKICPRDVPGALFVRGYTVMDAYWCRPDATAEVLGADGWLDTGDIARLRPDGHLVFIGRHKDMLKVGGENVSPAEVEGYLLALDGIEQVAVVGRPDPRLAEVPVAFVQLAPGAASDLTEESLIEHCRGRIAGFKIPRQVIFVDEMPVTPSGKIRKVELRVRAQQLPAQSS